MTNTQQKWGMVLLLLLAIHVSSFAEEALPTIAVLQFQTSGVEEALGSTTVMFIENALVNSSLFTVVERGQIEQAIHELSMQSTDYYDTSQAAEIGRFVGADQVIMGRLHQVDELYNLNVKMIRVETGVIEKSTVVDFHGSENLRIYAEQAVGEITASVVEKHPLRGLGIGFLAMGAGCLGGGIGFTAASFTKEDDALALYDTYKSMLETGSMSGLDSSYAEVSDMRKSAVVTRNLGWMFYGLSGASIITGILMMIHKKEVVEKQISWGALPNRHGGNVFLSVKF